MTYKNQIVYFVSKSKKLLSKKLFNPNMCLKQQKLAFITIDW